MLGNGITENRSYSNDNLLTAINYSNTSLGDLTYTWDANKNKTSESITGTMSGYGFTQPGTVYDDEDRLTGFARASGSLTQSWNLSTVGDWNSVTTNGTAESRTHGPTHELLTASGQSVNTDVKGNITLIPAVLSSIPSSASSLSWDFDNKLKSVDVGNDSSTDVEFKYDAMGRRVARVGSSGSYVYVQSDQQTIADYGVGDAPSSPLYRYVFASYIDEPVVRKTTGSSGTVLYFHRNQQYSILALTDSSGNVSERYAYTAYGLPTFLNASATAQTSSAAGNRYTYTAREWDATLGLHHFRARWMSGPTGRFLTRDPITYRGTWNLYSNYFLLSRTDPSGLVTCTPTSVVRGTPTISAIGAGFGAEFTGSTNPSVSNHQVMMLVGCVKATPVTYIYSCKCPCSAPVMVTSGDFETQNLENINVPGGVMVTSIEIGFGPATGIFEFSYWMIEPVDQGRADRACQSPSLTWPKVPPNPAPKKTYDCPNTYWWF